MDIRERKILLEQAKVILKQAQSLQNVGCKVFQNQGAVAYFLVIRQINRLAKNYNKLVPKINSMFKEQGIEQKLDEAKKIDSTFENVKDRNLSDTETPLLDIIIGSTSIVTFLSTSSEISEENVDRLSSITKELNVIKKGIDASLYQNLDEAKNEFEKGGFLGSSLICGKIVRFCLDSLPGKDINERIDILKNKGLIREKDGRDFLLKTNHFSRNLTSHDINIFPTSSESLSYLGDAIKIVKIFSEFQKTNKLNIEEK